MIEELRTRLRTARFWVRRAGLKADQLQAGVVPERKDDRSYVTAADRELEEFLCEQIDRRFPDDGILGEESRHDRVGGTVRWVLDPIDGTASYSMGLPVWAVSAGLLADGEPAGGVVWLPELQTECFGLYEPETGEPDAPETPFDSEDLLCVPSDAHRKFSIDFPGKTRSLGSTAFHMVLVLQGRACGALLGRRHLWDVIVGWGLSHRTDLELGILSGHSVDREVLVRGESSPEPLLFAHRTVIDRLRDRIAPR